MTPASTSWRCPVCGTSNPAWGKFCGTCGRPVPIFAPWPGPAQPLPPPPPPPRKAGRTALLVVLIAVGVAVVLIVGLALSALPGPGPSPSNPSSPSPPSVQSNAYKVWTFPDPAWNMNAFSITLPAGWSATGDVEHILGETNFSLYARDATGNLQFGFRLPHERTLTPLTVSTASDYISAYLIPTLQTALAADTQVVGSIVDRPNLTSLEGIPGALLISQSGADARISFTRNGVAFDGGVEVILIIYSFPGIGQASYAYLFYAYAPQGNYRAVEDVYNACLPTAQLDPAWLQKEMSSQEQQDLMYSQIQANNRQMFESGTASNQAWYENTWNALGGTQEWTTPGGNGENLPSLETGECYWQDPGSEVHSGGCGNSGDPCPATIGTPCTAMTKTYG